ncbi:MAG: hypothetical protein [Microvirus sp.]|nr:MAG: hypothetical protein [Microvirus sp.]
MKKNEITAQKVIRNWNNYVPSEGEINSGELMVIPDQAYTIPEIFEKFRRGINLPLERDVYYTDTDDFDDVDLRSTVKDPYDIDHDIVKDRLTRKQKGVILGGGLPEAGAPTKAQADGVKPTGNNSSEGDAGK